MSQIKTPDFVGQSLYDLDGGVFVEKINAAVAEVAFAVSNSESKSTAGKLVIELNMKRVGDTHQVQIAHKIKATKPTRRGKVTSEDETMTPLYCNATGKLTIAPDTQIEMFQKETA